MGEREGRGKRREGVEGGGQGETRGRRGRGGGDNSGSIQPRHQNETF